MVMPNSHRNVRLYVDNLLQFEIQTDAFPNSVDGVARTTNNVLIEAENLETAENVYDAILECLNGQNLDTLKLIRNHEGIFIVVSQDSFDKYMSRIESDYTQDLNVANLKLERLEEELQTVQVQAEEAADNIKHIRELRGKAFPKNEILNQINILSEFDSLFKIDYLFNKNDYLFNKKF